MFLDISVVLGIAETVVMPPVLKSVDYAKTFSQLKLRESFHIERVNPNSTNKLSMSIYR